MLSRNRPSNALRAAAAALVTALLVVAFAPIRLSAFDLTIHGDQTIDGKRTHLAYLIKTAGVKGTRGSIHIPYDERAARDLSRMTRDAVYFRVENRRWITHDEATIAEVRRALEPQDRFETASEAPVEAEVDALDRKDERLETQREALEVRKDALVEKLSALEEKWQDLKDQGRSTRAVEAEKSRLEEERDALQRRYDELARQREALAEERDRVHAREKALEAERERMDRQTLRNIERIMRRAIERGVAVSFAGGGSRNGGYDEEETKTRMFSPPSTSIW